MNDDSFIRAGLRHYAEAYDAVEAFREQMGIRLAQLLADRLRTQRPHPGQDAARGIDHGHSKSAGRWVFASTEPFFVSGDVHVSLQVGVAWRIDTAEGPQLYAGYLDGDQPQPISVQVGHPFRCVKYRRGHFLCTSPTESELDSQFISLLAELDRVLPHVRRA